MPLPRTRFPSRAAAGLPPVTTGAIIDAALQLTVEHGLENWSLRELARLLDVGPRVVYHHVGDRDAVVRDVVQRVVAAVPIPPDELGWRDWFTALLTGCRPVLRRHPGVARRLAILGPAVPAALELMDRGIRKLLDAGFEQGAIAAYRFLLNSALLQLAVEDDRHDLQPRAREELAAALLAHRDSERHPGIALVAADVREQGTDPNDIVAVDDRFYEYAIARTLDGVAAQIQGT
jgi:AcrR family transcriptional regulator